MKPIVLRTTSAAWTAIIGWGVIVLMYGDLLVRGPWEVSLRYGPGMTLVAWLLYVLFWAPAIVVDEEAALVRNIGRTLSLPYQRITDISIKSLVHITYLDNSGALAKVTSWNAPGLPRLGRSLVKQTVPDTEVSDSQILVDTWRERHSQPEKSVDTTPNWLHFAVLAVLVALTTASVFL